MRRLAIVILALTSLAVAWQAARKPASPDLQEKVAILESRLDRIQKQVDDLYRQSQEISSERLARTTSQLESRLDRLERRVEDQAMRSRQ